MLVSISVWSDVKYGGLHYAHSWFPWRSQLITQFPKLLSTTFTWGVQHLAFDMSFSISAKIWRFKTKLWN